MCSMFLHTNKPFESSSSLLYGSFVFLNTDVPRSFSHLLGGTEYSQKNPNIQQNQNKTHFRKISHRAKKSLPLYCFTAQNPRAIQPPKLQVHQQFGLAAAGSFAAQHPLHGAKARPGKEHSSTALSSEPPACLTPLPVSSCTQCSILDILGIKSFQTHKRKHLHRNFKHSDILLCARHPIHFPQATDSSLHYLYERKIFHLLSSQ